MAIWHAGEKAIQKSAGVAEQMDIVGQRVIRDFMPDQHREFFSQIPFVVLGSVDDQGAPWVTLVAGKPGFISSPTPRRVEIRARTDLGDPASKGLREGDAIGLLGIELHTRRRNRANGIVSASARDAFDLDVKESFGNCAQYIQFRDYRFIRDPGQPFTGEIEHSSEFDNAARDMIKAADTFFVASYSEHGNRRQVDVSHRGGKAGFARVSEAGTLTIPDFAGNLFFSTLGNILLNGKAGLAFFDFETGDILQMTGEAQVILESPEIAAFQGAERLWSFRPRRVVRRRQALPLRWTFRTNGWSPNSLMTGDWTQAADRLRAAELASKWRPFRVVKIVDESDSIRSFYLEPNDRAGLLLHAAGQYLPVRLSVAAGGKPLIRNYTLSVAPSDGEYRISVKREGLVSQHLHDRVGVGDVIETHAPVGNFAIDAGEERPAVLLAGGVGITPLLAMLRHIVYEGLRTRRVRPTILFQSAHSRRDRGFGEELRQLASSAGGAVRIIRVLSNVEDAEEGADYEAAGRIDIPLLSRFLSFNDYDFYLCGPPLFMQSLYDGLRQLNIADNRIHAEAFGVSSLVRTAGVADATLGRRPPSMKPVPVAFTNSSKEARWTPGAGTLLELAEARGLSPVFRCRTGSCGTCRTQLLAGAVTYVNDPSAETLEGEVLICCAVPAEEETDGEGRIQLAL